MKWEPDFIEIRRLPSGPWRLEGWDGTRRLPDLQFPSLYQATRYARALLPRERINVLNFHPIPD